MNLMEPMGGYSSPPTASACVRVMLRSISIQHSSSSSSSSRMKSMEIEGDDGAKIAIKTGFKTELGRGLGFQVDDRRVSRRHISLELLDGSYSKDKRGESSKSSQNIDEESKNLVHFEALGKNPIWVFDSGSGAIKVFRKSEKGFMRVGDWFCVCIKDEKPLLFNLKEGNNENGGVDYVKEFGFLVMGHEFDEYSKSSIRDVKDWEWFLDEGAREDSGSGTDDDDNGKRRRSGLKGQRGVRRKKKDEECDEDWRGESEDEEVVISNLSRGKRPRYSATRSSELGSKKPKDVGSRGKLGGRKTVREIEDDEDDEEDDDTLGGFIVSDEEDAEEEEEAELEDEEEDDMED